MSNISELYFLVWQDAISSDHSYLLPKSNFDLGRFQNRCNLYAVLQSPLWFYERRTLNLEI